MKIDYFLMKIYFQILNLEYFNEKGIITSYQTFFLSNSKETLSLFIENEINRYKNSPRDRISTVSEMKMGYPTLKLTKRLSQLDNLVLFEIYPGEILTELIRIKND